MTKTRRAPLFFQSSLFCGSEGHWADLLFEEEKTIPLFAEAAVSKQGKVRAVGIAERAKLHSCTMLESVVGNLDSLITYSI